MDFNNVYEKIYACVLILPLTGHISHPLLDTETGGSGSHNNNNNNNMKNNLLRLVAHAPIDHISPSERELVPDVKVFLSFLPIGDGWTAHSS